MANHIDHASDESFPALINEGIALVDFYADWCGPCRMLSPIIEALADQVHEAVRFVKVNTEECERTTARFGISSIPTLILFKEGEELERSVGLVDDKGLRALLAKAGV